MRNFIPLRPGRARLDDSRSQIKPAAHVPRVYPDRSAQQAFERAVTQDEQDTPEDNTDHRGVFGLFGPPRTVPEIQPIAPPEVQLCDLLLELCSELYVTSSAEAPSVRLKLSDDVLPGVVLTVFEDGAQLVAAFVCTLEPPRERLCVICGRLVQELADRLGIPAIVRVSTDDPAEPCTLELNAVPTGPKLNEHDGI